MEDEKLVKLHKLLLEFFKLKLLVIIVEVWEKFLPKMEDNLKIDD